MKTDELREAYLEFFASKGCVRRPSDVLVPNDPTVLFTPAGMNQFKREFMGLGDPRFKRATTCQKCIRTGDIENVGKTPRHMTFFEMLGNFSFGDYFKREAIHWAWEFLTRTLKIPAERLTVHRLSRRRRGVRHLAQGGRRPGGPDHPDGRGRQLLARRAPDARPQRRLRAVLGDLLPRRRDRGSRDLEPGLHPVQPRRPRPARTFAQEEHRHRHGPRTGRRRAPGRAVELRDRHLQADRRRGGRRTRVDYARVKDTLDGVRIRRASDHARALTFCIHENVRPGPEKQGYVVRRLLRRAVLDAYQMGQREPFLSRAAPVVAEAMKGGYPELGDSVPRIQNVIREEEERFLRNLENGMRLLSDTFKQDQGGRLRRDRRRRAPSTCFRTYGIPVEVTESLAADQNLRVDMAGLREGARASSRPISRGTTEAADVFATGPLDTLKEAYHHGTEFLGYADDRGRGQGDRHPRAGPARRVGRRLAEPARRSRWCSTGRPFYGESGGQVGDIGTIRGRRVRLPRRGHQEGPRLHPPPGPGGRGDRRPERPATAAVDADRRQAIRRAHSATHLLHHALHRHLGKHAQQAGSKVEPDRLRFDFANPEAVGKERLERSRRPSTRW